MKYLEKLMIPLDDLKKGIIDEKRAGIPLFFIKDDVRICMGTIAYNAENMDSFIENC